MSAEKSEYLDARILIVDDDRDNVTLLEKFLHGAGYHQVQSTSDPRQALELYRRGRHDLLLLDVAMPEVDGLELLEQLYYTIEDGRGPAALVVSAHDAFDVRRRVKAAGAGGFVGKPVQREEILGQVERMLTAHFTQGASILTSGLLA